MSDSTIDNQTVGFKELLLTTRTIDSKNRQVKLGKCIDFELQELMQAINEYNKGGSISIDIKIGVKEKNELSIQATVKTTKPKGKVPSNPYFRDQKGNLYMDDPNQLKIFNTRTVVDINETHHKGAVND